MRTVHSVRTEPTVNNKIVIIASENKGIEKIANCQTYHAYRPYRTYRAMCNCVVVVLFCFFIDFYMSLNYLLEKISILSFYYKIQVNMVY